MNHRERLRKDRQPVAVLVMFGIARDLARSMTFGRCRLSGSSERCLVSALLGVVG
jgi:hypothetical protein